jgi:small-conductance mechanosensitive channel
LEQGSLPGPAQNVQPQKAGDQHQQQEDAARLKRRIEQLKMEIREQQQERRRLHQELELKRKAEDQRSLAPGSEQDSPLESGEDDDPGVSASKQFHIPVYSEQFKKSCKHFSAGVVAKALRAATGFAVNDQQVLRQSRQLEKFSSIYRVRVGMSYRLLVRRKKGQDLEVLDLITRQDLDTWINTRKADD